MCTSIACCFGSCLCKGCCDSIGATFKQLVRLAYVLFDLFFYAIALVIVYGASDALSHNNKVSQYLREHLKCPNDQGLQCLGISSVFRISLALVGLHLIIVIVLFMRNSFSRFVNEKLWFVKAITIIGGYIGFMFVPNYVFQNYSKASMALSFVFLLFQIVMIIDLSYAWGTYWVKKYDEGKTGYAIPLIGFSLIFYGVTAYGIIRSYMWFSSCGVGPIVVSITLGLIGLATLFVFLKTHPNGSLLTTGAVALYSVYLTWSGLSNMDKTCNPLLNKESTTIAELAYGSGLIIVSLLYVSLGRTKKGANADAAGVSIAQGVLADDDPKPEGAAYKDEENGGEAKIEAKKDVKEKEKEEDKGDKLKSYRSNNYIYFHIVMIFASFYFSMLLTNWGQPVIKEKAFFTFKASALSMWIKIGCSWTTLVLYNWTLIAPKICRNRDFS